VFRQVLAELRVSGIEVPMCHAANTAATLDVPEAHLDAVRCGIGLAGLYPSSDTQRSADLHPVLRLKARVARVRRLAAGESIGYGGTFVLERPANVALMPIGYADGLPLALSNRGVVLVGGRRAPIVGRVSMDQTTMLLGDESIEPEAEVVLLGRQAAEEITAEELAALAGTSHYEFVTRIPPRLPRVYLRDGAAVQVQTLLGTQRL
jgi:alanine racemase